MSMKTFTYKPLVVAVTLLASILMTGLFDTSVSLASSACNTDVFDTFVLSGVDGRTTYAVIKDLMTWQDAQNTAKASGGQLAIISSEAQNTEIVTKLSSRFTDVPAPSNGSKAWIGLYDPQKTTAWSIEGSGSTTIMPERFMWDGGSSAYTNYEAGQPDGYCTLQERSVHPDRVCYGENSIAIAQSGKWYDEGDHGPTPLKLRGVVEWPNTILDCVRTTTPPTDIPDVDFPDVEAGVSYCKDQSGSMLMKCVKTTDGSEICPQDQLPCTDQLNPPVCPGNSVLNIDRDMCQADHVKVDCPSGFTWDPTIDRCVTDPTCPDGNGIFNPITDRCEAKISRSCPAGGYVFDEAVGRCFKPVECPSISIYNPQTDRCELSQATSCPANFSFNSNTLRCEKQPECAPGTVYSTTYNTCIAVDDAVCGPGYTWVSARGRCEKQPECIAGTVYSPTLNKCVSNPQGITGYAQATYKDTIIKYKPRNNWDPNSYCASPCAQDSVAFTFQLSGGKVELADVNAWGGAGSCAKNSPSWEWRCPIGELSSSSYDAAGKLTVYETYYVWDNSCDDYSCAYIKTYSLGGAAASASPSEFGTCPAGYTPGTAPDPSLCTQIITTWGNFSGMTDCTNAGSYSCTATVQACPAGSTMQDGVCIMANPTCTNGSFDGDADVCFTTPLPCTTAGTSLDNALGKCVAAALCLPGALNSVLDVCQLSPVCSDGYSFSVIRNRCELAPPTCPSTQTYTSTYSPTLDKCVKSIQQCHDGYSWSNERNRCERTVECPPNTVYSNASNRCESIPTCSEGTYNTTDNICRKVTTYSAAAAVTFDSAIPISVSGSNTAVYVYGGSYPFSLPNKVDVNTKELGPFSSMHLTGEVTTDSGVVAGAGYVALCQRGKDQYIDPYWVPTYSCGEGDFQAAGCSDIKYYSCGYESMNPIAGWGCGWGHATNLGYHVYAACGHSTPKTTACPTGGEVQDGTIPAKCTINTITAAICPALTNLDVTADKCAADVSCGISAGTLDPVIDVCTYANSACDSDWTYEPSTTQCSQPVVCAASGILDGAVDVCYRGAAPVCPEGTSLDANGICISEVRCTNGAFVPTRDRCEALVVSACSSSYIVSPTDNSLCTAAPVCPTDPASSQNATIAFSPSIDRCVAMPEHTCSTGLTWMSLPVDKCEAVPICDVGVYSNTSNACVSGACPTGGECKQISGDTTLGPDGTPMLYCSPNPCQDDTSSMLVDSDADPMGKNDLTDDGARNPDGTCAGQIYIFNGRDMRCTKEDIRGMIGSIAKIVAAIVLSVVTAGMGAAIMGAMVGGGTFAAGTTAAAVANAVATSIVTSVVNLAIDAATIGIQPGWLMQAGISLMSSAAMAYFNPGMANATTTNSDGTIMTTSSSTTSASGSQIMDVSNKMNSSTMEISNSGSLIEHYSSNITASKDFLGNDVYTMTDVFVEYSATGGATMTTVASKLEVPTSVAGLWALQAKQTMEDFAPAVSAGMLASYSTKKCCHPDKVSATCTASEFEEWSLQAKGNCHVIGTYCDTKFLSWCMATKETSCCFASKLARIFHEQGRPQIQAFGVDGGWGSTKSPRCRGFTPDEFQMIDFSQVDLSEYIADITAQVNSMSADISSYMNTVGQSAGTRATAAMTQ